MNGMNVIAGITHAYAVALASFEVKARGRRPFPAHGKCDAINRPAVEAVFGGVVLGEEHVEGLIRLGSEGFRAEARIAPLEGWRRDPLGVPHPPRVLDHDSHTVMAVVRRGVPHDPNSGMAHL